jgi:BRCT domain type II-containing protein
MARKVVNRKAKAAEVEAAAALEKASPKKATKKKTTARKTTTRKSKTKAAEDVRKKLYWGVFSQSLKRVAVFEFDQKEEAEARAEELSKGGKSPHFIQKVKEEIQLE